MKLILVSIKNYISNMITLLGKKRMFLLPLATLVTIQIFTISCNGNSNNIIQPQLYFPVQKEPQTAVLTALLPGELVADNGYLRVAGNLILWPHGYSLKTEGQDIWVINDKGQPAAKVGDWIKIGGGVVSTSYAEQILEHPLPEGCEGPYWLAAEIVNQD